MFGMFVLGASKNHVDGRKMPKREVARDFFVKKVKKDALFKVGYAIQRPSLSGSARSV
jgi:hypothetical protein